MCYGRTMTESLCERCAGTWQNLPSRALDQVAGTWRHEAHTDCLLALGRDIAAIRERLSVLLSAWEAEHDVLR